MASQRQELLIIRCQTAAQGHRAWIMQGSDQQPNDYPEYFVHRSTGGRGLFNALGGSFLHLISHDMGVISALQFRCEYPNRVRLATHVAVCPAFAKSHPKLAPAFHDRLCSAGGGRPCGGLAGHINRAARSSLRRQPIRRTPPVGVLIAQRSPQRLVLFREPSHESVRRVPN